MFAAAVGWAWLGCSDTASAQPQLTVTPATSATQPMVFNNIPAGEISQSQAVTVTTSNGTSATVIVQVNPANTWLQVSPSGSVNVPVSLNVSVNTTALGPGNYNGTFTVTVDGAPQDSSTVYVALTVTGVSAFTASPGSLSFTAQAGSTTANPSSTAVQINSTVGPLSYNLMVNYNPPIANWLNVTPLQGNTSGTGFTVSANPSLLSPSTFPATFDALILAQSTSTQDSVAIGVQLTITANGSVTVTPTNPPAFLYEAGTSTDPASQQLSITSLGGATSYSIQESPPVSWLVVSPLSGTASTTPSMITLNATPHEEGLTPATYSTNLIVTPGGQSPLPAIPITLVVAAHPLLQLSSNTLNFTVPFAGGPSATKSVVVSAVGSTGSSQVGFTASSNESWLTVTPSGGTTPQTLTIQVNPSSLSVQSYTGTITVAPTNGDNYSETITVNVDITSPDQLAVGPTALLFSYEVGQNPPPSQTIDVTSTGQPLTFTLGISNTSCGSNWLSASPIAATTTSPGATVTVYAAVTGIGPGTCTGNVILNYTSGTGPASISIPVTLVVSDTAALQINLSTNFGNFTSQMGGPNLFQQLSLTSTDGISPIDYSVVITNVTGGSWLGIEGATTGYTPQNLTLQASPGALTLPGVYTGTLVISSSTLDGASLTLTVTLTVTSTTTVTISPPSLTFSEPQGGSPSAPQTLTLTSSPGTATYTETIAYTNGSGWLQVTPNSGSANGTVTVTVLPNTLTQAQYTAQISFAFQDASTATTTIPVTLNVTPAQSVSVSAPSLSFSYQIGTSNPATQSLTVTSTGGSANISVSATSSGWLAVSPTSGPTPQTLTVTANPSAISNISAQAYTGSITISAPGVLTTPLTVPVTLTVTAAPEPQPVTIINNATGVSGVIAPGEEIAIKGNFLGPTTAQSFTVDAAGGVSNTLGGVQVLFDNNPGTPIYVSSTQINVMVPYEINGRLSTNMVVVYNNQDSQTFPLAVAPAAPGLFTNNFTGSGQIAALNQNGTVNGSSIGYQAATPGSVLQIYGTGGGQTNPPSTTGSVTPIPTSAAQLLQIPGVTATIGGLPATVNFAGAAPGLVTGVFQINVVIPPSITPSSAVPITVTVGGVTTPIGTTVAVQ